MLRKAILLPATALLLLAAGPIPRAAAQEAAVSEADEATKKLGFYFAISLDKLSQLNQANGLGVMVPKPPILGGDFPVAGPEVDGDLRSRWTLGFKLGFRLRNDKGSIETSFLQWDEQEDLFRQADGDKAIANTLASPEAGFSEDLGLFGNQGPPDGLVNGFEAFTLSEGAANFDRVSDGAEDLNFNTRADFIRFATSNRLVGELKTDFQVADVSYVRKLKQLRRLRLDGRFGLRAASAAQNSDVGYREVGEFGVYSDDEGGAVTGTGERRAGATSGQCGYSDVQDGDGDGETTVINNEADGDGFMDGNCNSIIRDRLEGVETVSEDRIIGNIKATGFGVHAGLDGQFELSKKWRLSGGIGLSVLSGKTEFRYRETFTSQRDRYPNFIEWDRNRDGSYDNLDLDFDGSCNGVLTPGCIPNIADANAIDPAGWQTLIRSGADFSYVSPRIPGPPPLLQPRGVNPDAFRGAAAGRVRVGDPIPESERNRDILQETTLLKDVGGESKGVQPMLDLDVGLEYQFSKFAHFDFGLRSMRWFGAGSFRSVATQVIADEDVKVDDGDLSLTGMYFTITITPR